MSFPIPDCRDQCQQQIRFWDDNQKSKSNGNYGKSEKQSPFEDDNK